MLWTATYQRGGHAEPVLNCCSTATVGSQVGMPEAWRQGRGVDKASGLLQHILARRVDTTSEETLGDTWRASRERGTATT